MNVGSALRTIMIRPKARNGTTTTNISASFPPMIQAITMENRNISGPRTATRIIIIKAFCTLKTSVVMRVTSDEDENLSMFSNAKPCTR